MSQEKKLTIIGHLDELRRRLLVSLGAVALTTLLSFFIARRVFEFLLAPAQGIKPVFTQVTEMFTTYIQVALLTGVVLAMPVLVYELIMYISPALTATEKRYLYLLLPGVLLFFLSGIAFAYFIFLPPALRFLLTFGSDIATPFIKIGNYISVVSLLLLAVGVVFETPLVVLFLAWVGAVTPKGLARNRKYALILAFVLAGVITPTVDPLNQSIVALPIIFLYELGIWLAKLVWRRERQRVPSPA